MSERLEDIAIAMVAEGQGILAADESTSTIKKRFDSINVESTEDSRRDYREMLFRSQEAMNDYISGVILFEETLYQKAADGTPFVDLIRASLFFILVVKLNPNRHDCCCCCCCCLTTNG